MQGLQGSYSQAKVKRKADALERQLRLVMHGIPLELVDHATSDQLSVMEEIVNRDLESQFKLKEAATSNGIGIAFGGRK